MFSGEGDDLSSSLITRKFLVQLSHLATDQSIWFIIELFASMLSGFLVTMPWCNLSLWIMRRTDESGPLSWGFECRSCWHLHIMKVYHVMKCNTLTWMNSLEQPKQQKTDMRFGTWNIRGLCRPVSLETVARKLTKFKLDFVGVQNITWNKGVTEQATFLHFSICNGMLLVAEGQVSFCRRNHIIYLLGLICISSLAICACIELILNITYTSACWNSFLSHQDSILNCNINCNKRARLYTVMSFKVILNEVSYR
jgi:hypothetical protein